MLPEPGEGPVDVRRRQVGAEPEGLIEVEAGLAELPPLDLDPAPVEVGPGGLGAEDDRDREAILGLGEAALEGVALAEVHPEGEVLRVAPAGLGQGGQGVAGRRALGVFEGQQGVLPRRPDRGRGGPVARPFGPGGVAGEPRQARPLDPEARGTSPGA